MKNNADVALKNVGDCEGAEAVADADIVGIRTGGGSGEQWTATKVSATDDGVMRRGFSRPHLWLPSVKDMMFTLHVLQIPDGVDRDPLVIEQTFNDEFPETVELKPAGENQQ